MYSLFLTVNDVLPRTTLRMGTSFLATCALPRAAMEDLAELSSAKKTPLGMNMGCGVLSSNNSSTWVTCPIYSKCQYKFWDFIPHTLYLEIHQNANMELKFILEAHIWSTCSLPLTLCKMKLTLCHDDQWLSRWLVIAIRSYIQLLEFMISFRFRDGEKEKTTVYPSF